MLRPVASGCGRCDMQVSDSRPACIQVLARDLPPTTRTLCCLPSRACSIGIQTGPPLFRCRAAMPPRGPTPYFLYSEEQRTAAKEELLAANAKAGVAQVAQLIGKKWGALSDEEKQAYKDRAQQLRGASPAEGGQGTGGGGRHSCRQPPPARPMCHCRCAAALTGPPAQPLASTTPPCPPAHCLPAFCRGGSSSGSSSSGAAEPRRRDRASGRGGPRSASCGGAAAALWLPHGRG
jgi:hypothetical protein